MKYFLTVDRGSFYNKERFKKVDIGKINPKLNTDNNLEAIYEFTTTFENDSTFKEFLIKQGLLDNKDMYFDLVITYEQNPIHLLDIAYASDRKYFDLKNLEQVIYSFSKNPERLRVLAKYYSTEKHVANELMSFRSYLSNPYADYKLYDVVRNFVEKICFKVIKNKRIKKYAEIYRLCMLVSKLDNPKQNKSIKKTPKNEVQDFNSYQEEDPEYFYIQELKESQDEQTRFF